MEEKTVFPAHLTKPTIRAVLKDPSLWFLLFVNVITIVIAIYQEWSAISIMTIYWAQSVIIGCVNVLRIVQLKSYSTKDFKINGSSVRANNMTKYSTAVFFAVHYGIFHFVYAVFLLVGNNIEKPQWGSDNNMEIFYVNIALFLFVHVFSYYYHRSRDQSTPNIGSVMVAPYIRIIPMHLSLMLLFLLPFLAPIFLAIKTIVDCLVHICIHASQNLPSEEANVN